jgi:hypothetical protein
MELGKEVSAEYKTLDSKFKVISKNKFDEIKAIRQKIYNN